MINLVVTKRTDKNLLSLMKKHYSQPKGFVGRNICYAIYYNFDYYGHIIGGSCTLNLPNRNQFFNINKNNYKNIINNIFYHIEKVNGKYPIRNFTTKVLKAWRDRISIDWKKKYGDKVIGFESLIEPPRTADLYKKDKWSYIGRTKGYTCKRVSGREKGVFPYGKRVWNYKNLRPKLVFVKHVEIKATRD